MARAALSLAAARDDRREVLQAGADRICALAGTAILARSRDYRSAPADGTDQD